MYAPRNMCFLIKIRMILKIVATTTRNKKSGKKQTEKLFATVSVRHACIVTKRYLQVTKISNANGYGMIETNYPSGHATGR